jgi:hypothetical protein
MVNTLDIFIFPFDIKKNGDCHTRYSYNNYYFDVVRFNGIDDYNNYLDDEHDSIFNGLNPIRPLITKIDGYDWDWERTSNNINVFELLNSIKEIGIKHVLIHNPDVVFYEASNKKLHDIYKIPFSSYGFTFCYKVGMTYIYLRNDLYHILKSKDK